MDPSTSSSSSSSSTTSDPPLSALFPPLTSHSPISQPITDTEEINQRRTPYTTHRCVSFCSQSSSRRGAGWDPVCRAVCWVVDKDGSEPAKNARPGKARPGKARPQSGEETGTGAGMVDEFQRAVGGWMRTRSLGFFKGTLGEMVEIQREGQAEMAEAEMGEEDGVGYAMSGGVGDVWVMSRGRGCAVEEEERSGHAGPGEEEGTRGTLEETPRTTSLAERRFINLIRSEESRLQRHQSQREEARSFARSDPRVFNYLYESLPSGGSHLLIPLTSVFVTPLHALHHRASMIFSPVTRLAQAYAASFRDAGDGTGKSMQVKGVERIVDQVTSGRVLEFGGKFLNRVGSVWGGWLGLNSGSEGKGGRRDE